jgi:hypothetical protein
MNGIDSRRIAVIGVVLAAVAAACLAMPAAKQLGTTSGLWTGAAILGLPVLLILAVSGYSHYGAGRALGAAFVIAALTCVVSFVVDAFAFAKALGGTVSGAAMAIVVFGAPAVCVLVLGLLAGRLLARDRAGASLARRSSSSA